MSRFRFLGILFIAVLFSFAFISCIGPFSGPGFTVKDDNKDNSEDSGDSGSSNNPLLPQDIKNTKWEHNGLIVLFGTNNVELGTYMYEDPDSYEYHTTDIFDLRSVSDNGHALELTFWTSSSSYTGFAYTISGDNLIVEKLYDDYDFINGTYNKFDEEILVKPEEPGTGGAVDGEPIPDDPVVPEIPIEQPPPYLAENIKNTLWQRERDDGYVDVFKIGEDSLKLLGGKIQLTGTPDDTSLFQIDSVGPGEEGTTNLIFYSVNGYSFLRFDYIIDKGKLIISHSNNIPDGTYEPSDFDQPVIPKQIRDTKWVLEGTKLDVNGTSIDYKYKIVFDFGQKDLNYEAFILYNADDGGFSDGNVFEDVFTVSRVVGKGINTTIFFQDDFYITYYMTKDDLNLFESGLSMDNDPIGSLTGICKRYTE
jgi:hypothetical protein